MQRSRILDKNGKTFLIMMIEYHILIQNIKIWFSVFKRLDMKLKRVELRKLILKEIQKCYRGRSFNAKR